MLPIPRPHHEIIDFACDLSQHSIPHWRPINLTVAALARRCCTCDTCLTNFPNGVLANADFLSDGPIGLLWVGRYRWLSPEIELSLNPFSLCHSDRPLSFRMQQVYCQHEQRKHLQSTLFLAIRLNVPGDLFNRRAAHVR
jgi:hypothetical protein